MPWNPDTYHRFQQERAEPFEDLFALVAVHPRMRAIDLGCGTGELTMKLANRLPMSTVTGIDSSPEMLARAAQYERPGLHFEPADIATIDGEWDLVFSHTAIQWVTDHPTLIPRLLNLVRPGGQLAIQIPSNHGHISHVMIREIAAQEPFVSALNGWTRPLTVLPIEQYAELLYHGGAEDIIVFDKIYPHVMENADALADWSSGTGLVPYFERMPEELHEPFMTEYRLRLNEHFPDSPVFYGFRRTLFTATRPV